MVRGKLRLSIIVWTALIDWLVLEAVKHAITRGRKCLLRGFYHGSHEKPNGYLDMSMQGWAFCRLGGCSKSHND